MRNKVQSSVFPVAPGCSTLFFSRLCKDCLAGLPCAGPSLPFAGSGSGGGRRFGNVSRFFGLLVEGVGAKSNSEASKYFIEL